ncbi:MAG: hypothetical protein ACREQY_15245, partial [Candidatus Binatia bacterium]
MMMRNSLAVVTVFSLVLSGTAGARTPYADACKEENDAAKTLLAEQDPRTKATAANGYNAEWTSCHDGKLLFDTCGKWEAAVAEGQRLLEQEAMIGTIWDASEYRGLWKAWGDVDPEPDPVTFAARVTERYGLQPAEFPNPYPLEKQDPAESDGGSGQLPMGLIQARDEDGRYTGEIGITCLLCHSNRIGGESMHGYGNNNLDLAVFNADLVKSGATPLPFPYPINSTRGTVNADSAFEILIAPRDFDTLDQTPFMKFYPVHPSPGDQDPPNWWNHG